MIFNRILAFVVDYFLILMYGTLLYLMTTNLIFDQVPDSVLYQPFFNQMIGFFSLTLPVVIYFILCETSNRKATVGKRLLGLKVQSEKGEIGIIIRNLIKFLPWELAHAGIHWLLFYQSLGKNISSWIWGMILIPQLIVIGYLVSLFLSGGKNTIYDSISNTKVLRV